MIAITIIIAKVIIASQYIKNNHHNNVDITMLFIIMTIISVLL